MPCAICLPVGTPAGISARFRLDIRIAVLPSLSLSAGSLGVASGILRASLLRAGAGAPIVNSDRYDPDYSLPLLHGRDRLPADDRL
jgi:hypothetical protein